MLTHDQLVAIRERAEVATPGPWEYICDSNVLITLDPDSKYACEIADNLTMVMDGEFIAHAREDIPLLTAEVIRLRTALAEMAHYEAPYGLDATGYEVLRIMARQALDNGGDAE